MSIKAPVLRALYTALWSLATPILRRHKRLKYDFESRLVPKNWPFSHLPSCQRIWIQAASGGEASLIAPLVEELAKKIANKELDSIHLLCSSCTRQGMDIIEKISTENYEYSTQPASPVSLYEQKIEDKMTGLNDKAEGNPEGNPEGKPNGNPDDMPEGKTEGNPNDMPDHKSARISYLSSLTEELPGKLEKRPLAQKAKTQPKLEYRPELKNSIPDQKQAFETRRLHMTKVFFPLDSPQIMQRALKQYQPDLIILLETELWPGLMHEAKKANIPYFIFNARMTEKSFNRYKKFQSFFRAHQPELVLATSQENAERYSATFGSDVSLMPNIKFDIALNKLKKILNKDKNHPSADMKNQQQAANNTLKKKSTPCEKPAGCMTEHTPCILFSDKIEDKPVLQGSELEHKKKLCLALASVREEEENNLIKLIKKLYADDKLKPFSLTIAPRHMHRIDEWKKILDAAGLNFELRSELKNKTKSLAEKPEKKKIKDSTIYYRENHKSHDYTVTLWDTFGELDFLYKTADAVFVGGSLAPLGGQNFLEALTAAIKPFIGPSYYNFEWIGKELFDKGFVHISNDACSLYHDIKEELLRLEKLSELELAKEKNQTALSFARFLEKHSGGSKTVVAVLQKYLSLLS